MNKSKWDSLPGSIQRIFDKVSEEWAERHGIVWTYYDKAGLDYFLSMPDRELIKLDSAEMGKWVTTVKPVKEDYIKEKSDMGLPAAEYDQFVQDQIKKWSGKAPSAAECADWVNQNIPQ
jgi:TRAP-type C4-dicarboxylate transport system substrate-binding protein